MNEEIKEILECMKQYGSTTELALLDYITNLQQDYDNEAEENLKLSEWLVEKQQRIQGLEAENETLSNDFKNQVEYTNKIAEEKEDYKSRCEKAIDKLTIKQARFINENDYVLDDNDLDEIMYILQNGSDSQ